MSLSLLACVVSGVDSIQADMACDEGQGVEEEHVYDTYKGLSCHHHCPTIRTSHLLALLSLAYTRSAYSKRELIGFWYIDVAIHQDGQGWSMLAMTILVE